MKHAAPKKKAGSVPVSRTIATIAVATAAAGAAAPAVATELPHSDLGLGDLPTTDIVELPDHDALVADLTDTVAGPRGVDLPGVEVPAVPADVADLGEAGAVVEKAGTVAHEAEAIAESAMPAAIPPVEQVAPDYTLPAFSGQGDVLPGALATAEAVKGTAEGAVKSTPKTAADAVDPAVQGAMGEAGGVAGVVEDATGATGIVDDATGTVDGVAGTVAGVPGDDIVGGVTGPVEGATAGAAGVDGVLDTATGLVG